MERLPDDQKIRREFHALGQVQVPLSGSELYSLIVAVQFWKSSFRNDSKLYKTMTLAEQTARKLHKALTPCPNAYTILDQGWNLKETEPDLTTKTNDTLS